MIEGFRIDVTADELVTHLDRRITHHQDRAQECETKLQQLRALETTADEEEDVFLMFARNYVVANEIYRLSEDDLRLLEWLPLQEASFMAERF